MQTLKWGCFPINNYSEMRQLHRMLSSALMILVVLMMTSCDLMPLNDAPPSYIKQVTTYKEGSDGIMIYIVLAASNGAMTTSDGEMILEIVEVKNHYDIYRGMSKSRKVLYSAVREVSKKEFIKKKVGIGAFEHEIIMYPIGRLSYQYFSEKPSELTGEVIVSFKPKNGAEITGNETVFF
jgi:hypothetical protein